MHLIAVQHDITWQDRPATHARIERLLHAHPPQPGSLIVLPETFDTGFGGDVEAVAEAEQGPGATFLAHLAREHQSTVIGGVTHRSTDGRGRNVALVFGHDGQEIARYTKIHPFTFSGEAKHFQPGERIVRFDWRGISVAPFICYDLRFPEVFRHAVRDGAEVLAVIANWPSARADHWSTLLRARAIENQAYVIGVNRCGRDPNLEYPGRSAIIDPLGRVLAEAGDIEAVLTATADPLTLRDYRHTFPVLPDIRPQFLGG